MKHIGKHAAAIRIIAGGGITLLLPACGMPTLAIGDRNDDGSQISLQWPVPLAAIAPA